MLTSLIHARRLVAGLLLLAYAVAATGVPLRVPRPKPLGGERFPCEDCGCGCATADYCWTQCCCHTMAERLAWAAREGVRPPASILRVAQSEGHDISRWVPDAPRSVLATVTSPKPKCCCCSKHAVAPQPMKPVRREGPSRHTSWRSYACGGALQLWLTISVALPLLEPEFPAAEAVAPVPAVPASLHAHQRVAPPTPPPQRLV